MSIFKEKDNRLEATFTFKDFKQAFGFMTQVAFLAESHNHHPDWSNSWNEVRICLTTHEADSTVTEKDRALAREIEALVEQ